MTAPAGSEDAGVVLSAEELEALRAWLYAHNGPDGAGGLGGLWEVYQRLAAARVVPGMGGGHGRDDESGRGAGL